MEVFQLMPKLSYFLTFKLHLFVYALLVSKPFVFVYYLLTN